MFALLFMGFAQRAFLDSQALFQPKHNRSSETRNGICDFDILEEIVRLVGTPETSNRNDPNFWYVGCCYVGSWYVGSWWGAGTWGAGMWGAGT